ncbi:MAG: WG repeat-containing protein [Pedosphaera sp.]|nr:WG repeat-containing protein [Pedosphaera sp.]
MKMKRTWFCLLFTVATLSATSVCPASTNLYPVVANGCWGYMNISSDTVINPQFDWARAFSEGLAPVRMGK